MHWEDAADVYFSESKTYSKDQTDSSSHSAKFKEDLNMQKQLLVKKL
jgi:hypothetical protein